jgi:glycosyltransferase involved in cell wall biosynthesis
MPLERMMRSMEAPLVSPGANAPLGLTDVDEAVPPDPGPGADRMRLPRLSVIVPCFNESANLPLLLPRLQAVLSSHVPDWEIIVVDDGSRDATREVLATWSTMPGLRVIELARNFGKEAAITAGLDAALGAAAVIMDADLQHPPELIIDMLARWQQGYDVVYAAREHRRDEGALTRATKRLFYRMINLGGGFPIPEDAGDFRLMDRAVLQALRALPERSRFMKGLYARVGFRSIGIPYVPEPRASGTTSFGARRLALLAVDAITSFTTWPLRLVSVVGLVLAMAAFAYAAYLVAEDLLVGHPVPGWATIVVGLMLFSGLQLMALGVMGEYVSRIYLEVKNRPVYVVRRREGAGLGESRWRPAGPAVRSVPRALEEEHPS